MLSLDCRCFQESQSSVLPLVLNWFDSIAHAMTTIATGGFSTRDASIGGFDSALIEYIVVVFMLVGSLPAKKGGIYMGIFNMFIVLPEIIVSLGLGWIMAHLLDNNRLLAVVLGGVCFLVAIPFTLRVQETVVPPVLQSNLTSVPESEAATP